jgi:hypothetical protein
MDSEQRGQSISVLSSSNHTEPKLTVILSGQILVGGNYKQIMKKDKPVLQHGSSNTSSLIAPTLPNLRFAHDRRLQDVERLLQYTRSRTIKVDEKSNMR